MMRYIILLLMLLYHPLSLAEEKPELTIAVSIKPLHSLVAGVVGDTGKVRLLLRKQSPHDAVMKPSHIKLLQQAEVIFYIADDFENFITRALASLPADNDKHSYAVAQVDTLTLLTYPQQEEHDGHHNEHDHVAGLDPHLWLSPHNAMQMVRFISQTLQRHASDAPEHRAIYQRNEAAMLAKLQVLDDELAQILQPVKHKPYSVLHNSYQYFQHHYGLAQPMIISNYPEHGSSAKQIIALNKRVKAMAQQQNISCIFREPQFGRRIGNALNKQQQGEIRIVPLPVVGHKLPAGEQLYFMLMRGLARQFTECLNG